MNLPAITIVTNHHVRDLVSWNDLPDDELRRQFNYIIDPAGMEGVEECLLTERFFAYRGSWYDVLEFQRIGQGLSAEVIIGTDGGLRGWDGVQTQSLFDAVLIRFPLDEWGSYLADQIIVGYCHW